MQNSGFQYNETIISINNAPNATNNIEATVHMSLKEFWLLADAIAIESHSPYRRKWSLSNADSSPVPFR
jgi:hypothetical protein